MKTRLTLAVRLMSILLPCLMGGCWDVKGISFGTETHWMCSLEASSPTRGG